MNAETFNSLHPVGTLVFAYPGARPEDIPSTRRLVTRTRSVAQSAGLDRGGVVWVDGHGAYIALTHVDVVPEAEWEAAKLADAVAAEGALPTPVGPTLTDERLTEIKSLLRYETSISFHSARAKESMLLLVAEVERLRAELEVTARPHTPRLCQCGHGHLAHTVPAPHSCFAFGQTCPCPKFRQLPHDEAVAQLKRNRQAAADRARNSEEATS